MVIHSQSGNTAKVAKALNELLSEKGNEVDISLLRTTGNIASWSGKFELRSLPDITGYDLVIFGGPVMGFRASPVIMKYLRQTGKLNGKKVLCIVTKSLPFLWTGGKQAIKAMEDELAFSGADLLQSEIVFSRSIHNEAILRTIVTNIAGRCTGSAGVA